MATPTYDRGTQYGGDDGFKPIYGGMIKRSCPVSSANTDTWLRGYVVRLLNTGYLEKDTGLGSTSGLKGFVVERRSPVGGRPEQDQVQAINKASIWMDPAVFETVHLTSGLAYAVNDKLYSAGDGKLRNTALGSENIVLGKVLVGTTGAADGTTTRITFYYPGANASS